MSAEVLRTPFAVSITGIDGAGKDTVALAALKRVSLNEQLLVAKTTRPYYTIDRGEVTERLPRVKQGTDWMHHHSDQTRNRRVIGAVNATNTMFQSRVVEPGMIDFFQPDIIASARDLRIDPAVYSGFYFPEVAKSCTVPGLVRRLAGLTGVRRDMIIWLQVDPEVAVERIEGRISRESQERESTGKPDTLREKWRHMHEDQKNLGYLAGRYEAAFEALQEIRPETRIIPIDTTYRTAEEVVDMVSGYIGDAFTDRMAA